MGRKLPPSKAFFSFAVAPFFFYWLQKRCTPKQKKRPTPAEPAAEPGLTFFSLQMLKNTKKEPLRQNKKAQPSLSPGYCLGEAAPSLFFTCFWRRGAPIKGANIFFLSMHIISLKKRKMGRFLLMGRKLLPSKAFFSFAVAPFFLLLAAEKVYTQTKKAHPS